MKTIHVPVEDSLYAKLLELKGKRTWLEFLEAIANPKSLPNEAKEGCSNA